MKIYFGHRDEYFADMYWGSLKSDLIPTIEVKSLSDARTWLNNKLEEIGFISYYQNCNIDNHHEWIEIDFGSYSTFCLFYDLNNDDWLEFYGGKKEEKSKTKTQKLIEKLGNKPTAHSSLADYVD